MVLIEASIVLPVGTARALPAGRAWIPMDTLKVPGHTHLFPDRIDLDSLGHPLLCAASTGGIGRDTHVLRWEDSTWALVASLGYGVSALRPVVSARAGFPLVWQTLDEIYNPGDLFLKTYLVMSALDGMQFDGPDTIALVWSPSGLTYTAAASTRRRWAAKHDYTNGLRVWYADNAGLWREPDVPGSGNYGLAIAPLNDTTALVGWAGSREGVRWGVLRGDTWVDGGLVPGAVQTGLANAPAMQLTKDSTVWFGWATDDPYVQLNAFRGSRWGVPESLVCAKRYGGQYFSREFRISRDAWEQATVAWIENNADRGFLGTLCVCVPSDSGYPVAEALIDTMDVWNLDVTRDANGDVWLVWQTEDDGLFWTHSHVTASASPPRFDGSTDRPLVQWSLSEPAPGSFWAVLRAMGGGAFEPIARLRAGPGTAMSFVDSSAPTGAVLRYRIRRESVDLRYRQESDEAAWWPRGPSLGLALQGAQPGEGALELLIVGAEAGALDVRAYDLQGREVAHQRAYASGSGQDRLTLALEHGGTWLPAAIYFVRVTDRTGRRSQVAKAVVIR